MPSINGVRSNLESIVGPAAEFHFATLVIEREPGDVNLTGGLEDARRHVQARAVVAYHNVGLVGAVETLVCAVIHQHVRFPDTVWRNAEVLDATVIRGVPAEVHVVPLLKEIAVISR